MAKYGHKSNAGILKEMDLEPTQMHMKDWKKSRNHIDTMSRRTQNKFRQASIVLQKWVIIVKKRK